MDPFNQVAQGREGTGAAFILSGNRAADIFHQQVSEDEKERRMLEFQRQKDERERRSAIDANLGRLDLKDHWIRHDEELRGQYNGIWNRANELKVQGIDPFLDTDWKNEKNRMDAAAAYSKQLSTQFDDFQKEISANRDKYSDESIERMAAYFDPNKPLASYMAEGMKAPVLEPRYTLSGMLKGIKGSSTEYDGNGRIIKTADRAANVRIAQGLQDTPDFKHFVKQQGGDPNGGAFPVKRNGKTIYSTQDEVLKPMVQKALKGLTPAELQGRSPEEAAAELLEFMKKQNAAHGTVIARMADQLDAGVDTSSKTDWNQDISNARWARIALDEKTEARQAKGTKKKDEKSQYLADLKAAIMTRDPEGIARFNAFLATINGKAKAMDKYLRVDILQDNKTKVIQSAMAALLGKGTTVVGDDGKKVVRFFIGNTSGAKGEIMLDNILKQIDLLKESYTPENYAGELDDMDEEEETVTGEFDDLN